MSIQAPPWRNRIVGESDEDPTQLLANPANWRIHPTRQRKALRGALSEVGWVQRVIVNDRTGHVIDGHLRVEEAISANAPTVPVLHVDLSDEEEQLVLATLDPLSAMAGTSEERLRELLATVKPADDALAKLLADIGHQWGDRYSKKITSPHYEVRGDTPAISELRDESRADVLRREINEADIPEDVREFLLAAACRHTVFHYARIADYYAAAPAEVQRLMEASALVIIDFQDAIERGFVVYSEAIAALAEQDSEAYE